MSRATATWKRVAMSLRTLPCGEQPAAKAAIRPLRLENLLPRRLLAADAAAQALQFTAGATIPGQVAGPLPPAGDGERPLTALGSARGASLTAGDAGNRPLPQASIGAEPVVLRSDFDAAIAAFDALSDAEGAIFSFSAPAAFAAAEGSTTLDSECAALEILIALLESQLQSIMEALWESTDPALSAGLQQQADGVAASIADAQASLDAMDCDAEEVISGSGGQSDGSGHGTTFSPSSGTSAGSSPGSSTAGTGSGGTSATGSATTSGTPVGTTSGNSSGGGMTSGTSSSGSTSGPTVTGTGNSAGTSGTTSGSSSGSTAVGTTAGSANGTTSGTTTTPSGGTTSGTSGDASQGTTGGGWQGSTAGSQGSTRGASGPAESTGPTSYSLRDVRVGAFDYSSGTDVRPVPEGNSVRVHGRVQGPYWNEDSTGEAPYPPPLTVRVDANFDGDFDDAGETVVLTTAEDFQADGYFDVYVAIPDDGPSPGNATTSDPLDVEIEVADVLVTRSATVLNVPPLFVIRPSLGFERDENDMPLAVVTMQFSDPGLLDTHTARVTWGDGVVTELDVAALIPEQELCYWKTVRLVRALGPEDGELRPLTATVSDDDNGEAAYQMLILDVRLNNDDDNGNTVPDYQDPGFSDEDDLATLALATLVTSEMTPENGTFDFSYDSAVIRVWDSPAKTRQILPSSDLGDAAPVAGGIAYSGQTSLWIEGVGIHTTTIVLAWTPNPTDTANFTDEPPTQLLGEIRVTVWGLDLDIDSDNNNGFDYPDNSDWEEYLEANEHALGKLIYPDETHFTPMRIRLNRGLDPNDPQVRVRLDFTHYGKSGIIHVWNTHKSDPARLNEFIADGGNRIAPEVDYALAELGYDPGSGGIVVFIEAALAHNGHSTKQGVITYGKPDDRIAAVLVGGQLGEMSDEVKYMAVNPNTFYPNLQNRVELRAAMASEGVYDQADLPEYALQLLAPDELRELFGEDSEVVGLIGTPPSVPGFGSAIYRDHVSGAYVLAYAGTNDAQDWIDNALQNMKLPSSQYISAMEIAFQLNAADIAGHHGIVFTGHSLGGGLASASSMVTGRKAYTFNSAGLRRETLLEYDYINNVVVDQERYPGSGSLLRYGLAAAFVDAYYLDFDILSSIQDDLLYLLVLRPGTLPTDFPGIRNYIFAPAIGTRIEMDGPFDEEVQVFDVIVYLFMAIAHKTDYYQYGLMVDEAAGWDIYGVPLALDLFRNVSQ